MGHAGRLLRRVQQEMKDKKRRNTGVRNAYGNPGAMAEKSIVHICGVRQEGWRSTEAELATSRHGLIFRRPEILGGPGISGRKLRCSNTVNIQSIKGTEQSRTGGREGLRVT